MRTGERQRTERSLRTREDRRKEIRLGRLSLFAGEKGQQCSRRRSNKMQFSTSDIYRFMEAGRIVLTPFMQR